MGDENFKSVIYIYLNVIKHAATSLFQAKWFER